jgi:hypothetical protein
MLASIPVNEMAETLRVLAGDNAANAARHFRKCSDDRGDASSAVLWTSIARILGAAPEAETVGAFDPVVERAAMQGVAYEDVEAAALAREERIPVSLAPIPRRMRALERQALVRTPATRMDLADAA